MKTSLIIHGHFYQPPREDPYTGIVPYQDTPDRLGNWNEQIFRTCYQPNAYSRYLDFSGKVDSITNNYSYISSNFGPTLLKWMDESHPDFMKKLREADRESIKRTGHSNFMAQCYNHTILPLENRRTKETEVKWAVEDYTYRFGHKPEGFWCAECAIDKETIDVLAENGITFVVLSPWQAVSINGVSVLGKGAPCDRAFVIHGHERKLFAFFYDAELASGISFGHLLRDADKLYEKLENIREDRNNPDLISWATDGEIYGHHEAFGDMALAALIRKTLESEVFEFTNFAAFLEEHGAEETAVLSEGEDGRGSSWSCSHGVKRWYCSCGCHTGGDDSWNQKWRTPLRNAFNNLEDKAREIFDREAEKLLGNTVSADQIIFDYGKVLSGRMTLSSYLQTYDLSEENKGILAELLDAMKNCMFSYTSCGWFFNDISGIEPSQCIQYAICCANRLQRCAPKENLLVSLLKDLSPAQSNIKAVGNGEDIGRRLIRSVPAAVEACGYFILNRKMGGAKNRRSSYGVFSLIEFSDEKISVLDNLTLERSQFTYEDDTQEEGTLSISFRNRKTGYTYTYTNNEVSKLVSREITRWMNSNFASYVSTQKFARLSSDMEKYLYLAETEMVTDIPAEENAAFCAKLVNAHLQKVKKHEVPAVLDQIWPVIRFIKVSGRMSDYAAVKRMFDRYMNYFASIIAKGELTEESATDLIGVLTKTREEGIYPDITLLQNEIYPILTGKKKTVVSDKTLLQLRKDLNFTYPWV